jgi:hypothetical protein
VEDDRENPNLIYEPEFKDYNILILVEEEEEEETCDMPIVNSY